MILSTILIALAAATPHATLATPVGTPVPVFQPTVSTPSVTSWGAQHLPVLYLIQILFLITVVGLIALMSIQTTKTEGLSGSIGGRMESAYRGRLGLEQRLQRVTTGFAVAFMFLAILDFLITR